jgi:ribosomal protein S18 acetylase RimI-like enzyme
VPELQDRDRIRAILEIDRNWSAYALADLEPGYFEHSAWFAPDGSDRAVVLVYSEFEMPVVLAVGEAVDIALIFEELQALLRTKAKIYFVVRPQVLPLFQGNCTSTDLRPMLRMVLDENHFAQTTTKGVDRLSASDLAVITSLFEDGTPTGESPDFFIPSMLDTGIYCGIHEGECLVSVAGTHVFAPGESVAGLGNIYTRRDRRGRGLGSLVTSAVTSQLLGLNFRTIVLNVNENNTPAIRVYEKLGFRPYCSYFEMIGTPLNIH